MNRRLVAVVVCVAAFGLSRAAAESPPAHVALRIGLMPAADSIPLVVADAAGLYAGEGVTVDLVPFNGQLERETALQTGALDGTVTDLVNAIQGWRHGSGARAASITQGDFCLLAAPTSTMRTLADWPQSGRTVRTGMLENSIVNYLTQRMLTSAGANPGQVELVPIVQLPARLEMLLAGKVEAACLPEPLASVAVTRGARRLADSEGSGATPGALLFTGKALSEKAPDIAAFYRAYDAAVDRLAASPGAFREEISRGCAFPPGAADVMRMPRFTHHALPPAALVDDVAAWMVRTGLLDKRPEYTDIVTADFASHASSP
ncbi:MAG TPA: ABC transporter substrate-binding protein [Spirochaetia bacterium]|nr:ABC transporter substrate-binding protein [Spirochaetia bacterium]